MLSGSVGTRALNNFRYPAPMRGARVRRAIDFSAAVSNRGRVAALNSLRGGPIPMDWEPEHGPIRFGAGGRVEMDADD